MVSEKSAAHDENERRLQAALDALRHTGTRRTSRRIAVLRVLIGAHGHLSLNEINERLERSGAAPDYSTTWRALLTLTDLGIVHALRAEAIIPTYGMADHPHFHAVCQGCEAVGELPADALTAAITQIEQLSGMSMADGSLLATGTCPNCARPEDSP